MMTQKTISIIVLGGGYAGVMAALRVAGRTRGLHATVKLINRSADFVERPRLPEVAVGKQLQQRSIEAMLDGSSAEFLQAEVTKIDAPQQEITIKTIDSLQIIAYDYLIVALGSQVNRHAVVGVDQFAYVPDSHGQFSAEALAKRLQQVGAANGCIAVIGGGATGIEMATEIRSAYPDLSIMLITQGKAGAFKDERVEQHFRAALDEQAIELVEHCTVTKLSERTVHTQDRQISADLLIWAGGFIAPSLACDAGIEVNQSNQVMVDPYLRSISHPNIFAAGDIAFPTEPCGTPVRMALLPALVMGATTAENVAKTIKGKPLKPLSFVWYGQAITLGASDAVGFNTFPADQAVGPILRGKLALRVRNFFVRFLVGVLEWERRWTGAFYWNGQRRYRRVRHLWQTTYD